MYLSDICTIPMNLSGDPGISVPISLDHQNLPIGFHVMAPSLGESVLFRVAAEVERLAEFTAKPVLQEVAG
jgi:aspartyl-tRNA(Asn)/glutamyl-tRNA(Gln) amidotransferase subunit A